MKQYAVKITDEALEDMDQIYGYIANVLQSPGNALSQYKRIADAISRLDLMPERFQLMDFIGEDLAGLRRMPVDHFSVFYVIKEDRVIITNVLYSASDIQQRLIEKCVK